MADPASIRTNNPGAMWFGPIAQQFGATRTQNLADGNNAAIFDDPVNGAAAHFALLKKNYAGMPLSGAITKWSGGNSSPAYADFVAKRAGLTPDTVLTPDLLASPQGLALAKAQAHWEAGKPYPLSDEQWATAQSKGLGTAPLPPGAAAVAGGIGTPMAGPTPSGATLDTAMADPTGAVAKAQKAIDGEKEATGEKNSKAMMALAQQLMAGSQRAPVQFTPIQPGNTGPVRPLPLDLPKFPGA